MKARNGYCKWHGVTMNQLTEEDQEDCDYSCGGDCKDCDMLTDSNKNEE